MEVIMKRKVLKRTSVATIVVLAVLLIAMLFVFAFPKASAKAVSSTVNIMFLSDGGSECEPIRTVKYGDSVQLPTSTKLGYNFVGWSLESGNANKLVTSADLWNKYIPVEENEVLTLYAIWSPKSYKFTFIPNNGIGTYNMYYNVEQSTKDGIRLPIEEKLGYRFKGWNYNGNSVYYIDLVNILNNGGDDAANAVTLSAQWTPVTVAAIDNDIQNLFVEDMFLDFSSAPSNGPYKYYIKNSVEIITLYGNGKDVKNASFVIEARNTELKIVLYNIKIFAPDNTNAIYAEDANSATLGKVNGKWCMTISGNTTLNIECIGANNEIHGGTRTYYDLNEKANPSKYCSGIVAKNINIRCDDLYYWDYDLRANLQVYGGSGHKDYYGINGGAGIWASYFTAENYIKLQVYGGHGSKGKQGEIGETGDPGVSGHNDGYIGGTGATGERGGDGRYALNVSHKITVTDYAELECTGGNGGKGGKGGKGGTGGTGREAALFRYAGNGGKGGTGGTGGNGGTGFAAIMNSAEISEMYGGKIVSQVGGTGGAGGEAGDAGDGGQGGKRLNGTRADSGAPGAPGKEGAAGASNTWSI